MRAAVLFDGAGGSGIGLEAAGFECVGYEVWPVAVATRRANGGTVVQCDLSDPASDDLIEPAELWWISSPCQPFSAAGDGAGEFDDRDGLPWALRAIARHLPAVVIFENVKGLTFAKHGAYLAGILASLRALGYEVDIRVLNCADYGVPQTRERCIIIARRDGGPITWPMPTHTEQPGMFTEPWVTMAEALGWGDGLALRYNRGAGMEERHGERRPHPFSEPAPTITSHGEKDFKVVSQWWLERPAVSGSQMADAIRLTIDELACLQGFPPGYQFTGNKGEQAKQVGNAVPPALAEAIARVNVPAAVLR